MDTIMDQFQQWMKFVCPLDGLGRRFARLIVLIGPPSSGKTTLVQHWIDSVQDEEAVPQRILTFEAQEHETPNQFFSRLLGRLGGGVPIRRPTHDVMMALGGALQRAGVALLVIDDAEKIKLATLQFLRGYLYDDWGISLLLVGQSKLMKTCARDEAIKSRITAAHSLTSLIHNMYQQTGYLEHNRWSSSQW